MARLLELAQNEHLSVTATPLSLPFAMSIWFFSDTSTPTNQSLMSYGDQSLDDYHSLRIRDPAQQDVIAISFTGTSFFAGTSTSWSTNTWHHAAGIWVGTGERRAFLDGGGKATDNSSVSLTPTEIRVGIDNHQTNEFPMSGSLAWASVYNLASYPGATDVQRSDFWEDNVLPSLAAGWSPLFFPLGLAEFWPLGGFDTNETDGGIARGIVGGFDMSANSDATGPGISDHPGGLIYPSTAIVVPSVVAAVGFGGFNTIIGGGIIA